MKLKASEYWTPHNILTYNAIFNFSIGARGKGKTFGSLRHCIKHFIKKRRLFIYMRRYETNFSKKEKMLSAVSHKFPNYEMRVEGMRMLIREAGNTDSKWEIMGYLVPLSTGVNDKSIPFDDVDYIIYDEFIISKGAQHYIKNEVEVFIDYYNTVDRLNDRVRVFFLANAVSIVNPYFIYFNLTPRKGQQIKTYRNGYIALEIVESSGYAAEADKTRFGKMIKNTAYYDYAIGNEFNDDNDVFISKRSQTSIFHSAYKFDDQFFSVWLDVEAGNGYISPKIPKNCKIFSLTKNDMQPNLVMYDRSSKMLKGVNNLFNQSSLYFENVVCRDLFYQVSEYLNL